ncbi:MAG: hypothetical protein HZB25_08175 [Candidatus Eisenbacteria bacterium]|nr:hypothetical protein [Candidatus Eisenbacteria bacterium]
MNRNLARHLSTSLLAGLLFVSAASAQSFGQFGVLTGIHPGRMDLGAYFGGSGGDMVPTFELRGDLSSGGSLGLQATVEHRVFGAQLDLRRALVNTGGSLALDLGGQVAGGFATGRGSSRVFVQIVPGASGEWRVGGRQTAGLWTGVGLRLTSPTGSSGAADGVFRFGGRFGFTPEVGMAADFENVGGRDRLMLGVDYRFGGSGMRGLRRSR